MFYPCKQLTSARERGGKDQHCRDVRAQRVGNSTQGLVPSRDRGPAQTGSCVGLCLLRVPEPGTWRESETPFLCGVISKQSAQAGG